MRRRPRTALFTNIVRLGALGALAVAIPSCLDLNHISLGVCGNFVVDEATEDCEGSATEAGTTCAGPGDDHACRYTCTTSVCPLGYGCGETGVCRRASGSFTAMGSTLPVFLVERMRVGDFDGDGSPDILALGDEDALGRVSTRLIYSPGKFDPTRVLSLPVHMASPSVGIVDTDNITDIAYADVTGVSIFRGRADHQAEFTPFPSVFLPDGASLRVIPLDVLSQNPGDELVALIDEKGMGPRLVQLSSFVPAEKALTFLPGGAGDLAGDITWGKIDESSPCPQIVLPYRDASAVLVFTPCRSTPTEAEWNDGGVPKEIKLPPGKKIDRGALLVNLDLDHHLDLLIGADGQAFVAWGKGDGTFTSQKPGGQNDAAGPYPLPHVLPPGTPAEDTFPLAAQDLNGDGVVDFVIPQGVVISSPKGYTLAHANLGQAWTVAAVADFNANGRLDIIAGSTMALDLDFLNNAGGGVFNLSTLPTAGPAEYLAVGDFDGDLVNDIALSQEFHMGTAALDLASVAFGASHGAPSSIGSGLNVGEVAQLVAAHLPSGTGMDGIADLLVVAPAPASNTDSLFVVHGSSARALTCALPLSVGGSPSTPIAMAIGRFGDETNDIATLGVDDTTGLLRLWRVDGYELIALSHLEVSSPLDAGFRASDETGMGKFRYGAVMAAANLNKDDTDKTDEVVIVAPYGDDPDGAAMVIADYDASEGKFLPRKEHPITAVLSPDSSLSLRDVDGDSLSDAVLLSGSDDEPGEVVVFWNDEHGGLAMDTPTSIHVNGGAVGVGCLPSPKGRGCDLVIASRTAIYIAKPTDDRQFLVSSIFNLGRISDVAVGDFDRDGIADFTVTTDEGIKLYRSLPVLQ